MRELTSAGGETRRTFAEIEAESHEIARRLEGIAPRAVVAIRMGNRACWPALLLALFRRAFIPLPLGEHMEGGELAANGCGLRKKGSKRRLVGQALPAARPLWCAVIKL